MRRHLLEEEQRAQKCAVLTAKGREKRALFKPTGNDWNEMFIAPPPPPPLGRDTPPPKGMKVFSQLSVNDLRSPSEPDPLYKVQCTERDERDELLIHEKVQYDTLASTLDYFLELYILEVQEKIAEKRPWSPGQ